jgi:hypothetical protein
MASTLVKEPVHGRKSIDLRSMNAKELMAFAVHGIFQNTAKYSKNRVIWYCDCGYARLCPMALSPQIYSISSAVLQR